MRRIHIKLSTLLPFVIATALGVSLFWVSQQVQQLERQKRDLESQIASEEEGLRVLSAEWDYLNRPDRIEELAAKYLDKMQTVTPDNLIRDASAVPEPQLMEEDNSVPVLVSNQPEEDTHKPTLSAEPAPRPIDDQSTTGSAKDFGHVLGAEVGGDDQ